MTERLISVTFIHLTLTSVVVGHNPADDNMWNSLKVHPNVT